MSGSPIRSSAKRKSNPPQAASAQSNRMSKPAASSCAAQRIEDLKRRQRCRIRMRQTRRVTVPSARCRHRLERRPTAPWDSGTSAPARPSRPRARRRPAGKLQRHGRRDREAQQRQTGREPAGSSRLRVIVGVGLHRGGRGDAVGHVEEAGDRGDVPDVAVGEAGGAQRLAVVLGDARRSPRSSSRRSPASPRCRGVERRRPASSSPACSPSSRVARQLPHRRAMRDQAVVAPVHRRHDDRDHLAFELGQRRRRRASGRCRSP